MKRLAEKTKTAALRFNLAWEQLMEHTAPRAGIVASYAEVLKGTGQITLLRAIILSMHSRMLHQ